MFFLSSQDEDQFSNNLEDIEEEKTQQPPHPKQQPEPEPEQPKPQPQQPQQRQPQPQEQQPQQPPEPQPEIAEEEEPCLPPSIVTMQIISDTDEDDADTLQETDNLLSSTDPEVGLSK